jgi:ribosomal protein S18 acetylase RimI-like enzyme
MIHLRDATLTDTPAIARVHVDAWRTTYRGLLPADYLANLSYAEREQQWQRALAADSPTRLIVATSEGGEVIGFVAGGPERSGDLGCTGELYAIYLLAEYQRQGIGRRLTHALVRQLRADNFASMAVWVLADNPARHFYEALGGVALRAQAITIGSATLNELAYGWADLAELEAALAKP